MIKEKVDQTGIIMVSVQMRECQVDLFGENACMRQNLICQSGRRYRKATVSLVHTIDQQSAFVIKKI